MEYEIKIAPTDLKIMPATELEEILQNCLMILLTEKYSVPMDREFGVDASFIDAPISRQSKIVAAVAQAIRTFEPRARLKKVNFGGDMVAGQVIASVVVEIL